MVGPIEGPTNGLSPHVAAEATFLDHYARDEAHAMLKHPQPSEARTVTMMWREE